MSNYKLKSIQIELQTYGEYKGKYIGKVKYENDESEAFMFNLSEERCNEYLKLVSEELVAGATELGKQLAESMKLIPNGKTVLQITPQ